MAFRVDGFRPAEGWPGSILLIDGAGFSSLRDDNEVFIGGDRALTIDASPTQLRVLAGEKTVTGTVEVVVKGTRTAAPVPFRVLPMPDVANPTVAGPPEFFHGPQHGTPTVHTADQPLLYVFAFPTDLPPGPGGAAARTNFINNSINPAMQFWKEATYGQTTWSPTITDWLPLPNDRDFYFWRQTDIDRARFAYITGTRRDAAFGLGELWAATQGKALNIASRGGTPVAHTAGDPVTGVVANASNLFVVAGTQGLTMYEPPRPDNSMVQVWTAGSGGAWFHDVDVSGGILAVAALDQGTWLWALSSGSDPVLATKIPIATPSEWATTVRVVGKRLFVAEGQTLRIFDLTNLLAPAETGKLNVGKWIMHFDVAGNLCAVATDGNGLQMLDVSLAAPAMAGQDLTVTRLHAVDLSGTMVFAAGGTDGLIIYDVSSPKKPAVVGKLATDAAAYHVVAGATRVDVSTGARHLVEVDASTPASPAITNEGDLPPAVFVPDPSLNDLQDALKVALDSSGEAQQRGALFFDAFTAAQNAGFDINGFQGFIVVINTDDEIRANSGLRDQFQNEATGETLKLNESSGTYYCSILKPAGTLAHEIGHWFQLPDLYTEVKSDGSAVAGTAERWSIMGISAQMALYTGKEIQETLQVYQTSAPNVNVVELQWSPTDPPLDRTFDIVAHSGAEDTDPSRIHLLKLVVASGLTYYVEVRQHEAGKTFDQNIPLPAKKDGTVLVTRVTEAMSISNTSERPVELFGAIDVGEQVVDAARRLIISVDSIVQTSPLVCRVRLQWNQAVAGDPNGQFDMTITPWNTDTWETIDIWVDSPRNNSGGVARYENHELGDDTKPVLNGDRPWVKRKNKIFGRIRNTGPATVPDVWVTFYTTSPPGIGDNGNWAALDTQHLTNFPGFDPKVPGSGEQIVSTDWIPAADQHTCLRVSILPQIGEISTDNNMAQENVFTFDSPGSSSHDPVTLAARVRSPFSVHRKVDTVVRGLPKGWHVVVDHAWVWTGPKGEHDLTAVIWTDLDSPFTFGPPLTQEEKLHISRHIGARIEGWTDFVDRYLPIGGILADVKANRRVTGTLTTSMEGSELMGRGQLTPALPNIPICIEVISGTGVQYLYALTDGSGAFDLKNGGRPLKLASGSYIVQPFVSGNDDAAETALPAVNVVVP